MAFDITVQKTAPVPQVPAKVAPVAAAPAAVAPAAAPSPKAGTFLPLPALVSGEIPPDQHIPLDRLRSAIGRRMGQLLRVKGRSAGQSEHFPGGDINHDGSGAGGPILLHGFGQF